MKNTQKPYLTTAIKLKYKLSKVNANKIAPNLHLTEPTNYEGFTSNSKIRNGANHFQTVHFTGTHILIQQLSGCKGYWEVTKLIPLGVDKVVNCKKTRTWLSDDSKLFFILTPFFSFSVNLETEKVVQELFGIGFRGNFMIERYGNVLQQHLTTQCVSAKI